jgi:mannose-6-phosphate isomerase
MAVSPFLQPLVFAPVFMERVWGGRRLEMLYGKRLPPGARIGESWEIVDRPEAQSIVGEGPWVGATLHDLWLDRRGAVFGDVADAPRFPLLIKLLDAQEKLSLQVHPPAEIAAELGGEPKTEFWYIADATEGAEVYVGMKTGSSREAFAEAIARGDAEEHVHRVPVKTGDAMFLASGRVHAIGAGNLIVEVQQNSDTTYRVFDWNRSSHDGTQRTLHVEQALRSIDFEDCDPRLLQPKGESLLNHPFFDVEKWQLGVVREAAPMGQFAIVGCLSGSLESAGVRIGPGEFFLLPASMQDRTLRPLENEVTLLRITIGNQQ